jgi:hypothetical protein
MKQILKNSLNVILVLGIIMLYVAFLSLDIFSNLRALQSKYLKYARIVLCFIIETSLAYRSEDKRDSNYIGLAFIFTMIANIFLLFTSNKIIGIFFFCLVQLTYLKRYDIRIFKAGISFALIAMRVHSLLPFQSLYVITVVYAILIGSCFLVTFRTKLPKFNFY